MKNILRNRLLTLLLLGVTLIVFIAACDNPTASDSAGGSSGGGDNGAGGNISENIGALVEVPAGSFQRDEDEQNISVITRPFRMSEHQITQAQFEAIMGVNPSQYTSGEDAPNRPVERVSWYGAIAFANKLSLAEGLTEVYSIAGVDFATLDYSEIPTSSNDDWDAVTVDWEADGYRLPTEMEWMWAAMGADQDAQSGAMEDGVNRNGYSKPFAGSDGSNSSSDYAWSGTSVSIPRPVGTKQANELGLYDMSGNVWEWTWDWFSGGALSPELFDCRNSRGLPWRRYGHMACRERWQHML